MKKSRTIFAAFTLTAIASLVTVLWLGGEGEPEASAQEVVKQACSQVESAESYDFTATITQSNLEGSRSFSYLYYLEVQGDDFYMKETHLDGSYPEEAKFVDGVSYEKLPGQDNYKIATYDFHDVTTAFSGLGGNPLCPDASRFRSLGQTRDASGTYRTYTDMPVNPTPFPTTPATAVVPITRHATGHEISVNRRGQLHRLQMTIQDYMVSNGK